MRAVAGAELDAALAAESRLVLLAFLTTGCEPCRELRARLVAVAAERADVCAVLAVDADHDPATVARYGVTAFPTLVFLKRGEELHRIKGGALPASTLAILAPPC